MSNLLNFYNLLLNFPIRPVYFFHQNFSASIQYQPDYFYSINQSLHVSTSPSSQVTKNIVLQWGELPTSVAYIGTGQIMGWGNKAIEIRSVETGHLDGVFMHKKAQKLKFLCERNDKVRRFKFDKYK